MTTHVHLGAQRIALQDADLLGEGGEARVFRHGKLALKVFHPTGTSALRQKLEKLQAFPTGLPAEVVAPTVLLHDDRKNVVGYAMPRIDGAEDVLRLSQRSFRQGAVDNQQVTQLFQNLRRALEELHARAVVVGDLNDCNVLFNGTSPFLIDADSMQFGRYPCPVGHERFLDPRLYGKDLARAPMFSPHSDWYAFAVQLFGSLLFVHPYGGVHKALPTLLRRAEARHSVLRADVRYPKGAVHWRVLPEPLLAYFERVFDKDERPLFPAQLLDVRWTHCRCGAEHARPTCPECSTQLPRAVKQTTVHSGRCTAQVLFRTEGRILAFAHQGGPRLVFEENGAVFREDRTPLPLTVRPGMRFAVSGATTWAGDEASVVGLRAGKVHTSTRAALFQRAPSFDARSDGALFVQDDWLVTSDGARLGKVLGGQTFLRAGEKLAFGFYRAGQCTFYFLVRGNNAGLREVALPPLSGRLIDAACAFDDHHVLFTAATERDGRRTHTLALVDETRAVLARREGSPDGDRVLASLHGKALHHGRMLTLTDDGLLSLAADHGRIEEGTLFPDTQPFVSEDAHLFAAPNGAALVVTPRVITQLTLT